MVIIVELKYGLAYNEEANIGAVIEQTFAALTSSKYRFEMIVVDDGSDDATARIVKQYCDQYPVSLVALSRNFGKEAALLAGLDHSDADATIIMDADLQHPIELIDCFLEEWEAGYRCVYAVKEHRKEESMFKVAFVKLFYLLVNHSSEVRIEPDAVDFRLLDRCVVESLRSLRERVRFMKGLYAWVGFRSKGIPFTPKARYRGRTKFSPALLFRLGWDGLTSFSDLPLRISSLVGLLVSVAALSYGAYETVRTLVFGIDVPGWATLVVAVTLLSGVQMMFLGIIGQYIRKIFLETKDRPNYLLTEVVTSRLATKVVDDGRAQPPVALSHADRQRGG